MRLYVSRSDGAYTAYDGMTQDQIVSMLADQGFTVTWISETDYLSVVARSPKE